MDTCLFGMIGNRYLQRARGGRALTEVQENFAWHSRHNPHISIRPERRIEPNTDSWNGRIERQFGLRRLVAAFQFSVAQALSKRCRMLGESWREGEVAGAESAKFRLTMNSNQPWRRRLRHSHPPSHRSDGRGVRPTAGKIGSAARRKAALPQPKAVTSHSSPKFA